MSFSLFNTERRPRRNNTIQNLVYNPSDDPLGAAKYAFRDDEDRGKVYLIDDKPVQNSASAENDDASQGIEWREVLRNSLSHGVGAEAFSQKRGAALGNGISASGLSVEKIMRKIEDNEHLTEEEVQLIQHYNQYFMNREDQMREKYPVTFKFGEALGRTAGIGYLASQYLLNNIGTPFYFNGPRK